MPVAAPVQAVHAVNVDRCNADAVVVDGNGAIGPVDPSALRSKHAATLGRRDPTDCDALLLRLAEVTRTRSAGHLSAQPVEVADRPLLAAAATGFEVGAIAEDQWRRDRPMALQPGEPRQIDALQQHRDLLAVEHQAGVVAVVLGARAPVQPFG